MFIKKNIVLKKVLLLLNNWPKKSRLQKMKIKNFCKFYMKSR